MLADDGETTWLDVEPGDDRRAAGLPAEDAVLDPGRAGRCDGRLRPARRSSARTPKPRWANSASQPRRHRTQPVPGPKFAAAVCRPDRRRCTTTRPAGRRLGAPVPLGVDLLVPRSSPRSSASCAARASRRPASGPTRRCGSRPAGRGSASKPITGPSRPRSGCSAPAVHLDKGCYRGQETVARVHNLGRPPRRLVLLHLDGIATDQLPAQGTPMTAAMAARSASSAPPSAITSSADRAGGAQAQRADDAALLVGESAAAIDLADRHDPPTCG